MVVIPLTDRLPVVRVFAVSTATMVAASVLFPLVARDMLAASALRAVGGAGLVGVYMPGLRLISQRFADRGRGAAMGLYVTALYTASAISLSATGRLMARYEWRDAFLILAVLSVLSIPLAYGATRGLGTVRRADSTGFLNIGVMRNRRASGFILGYSLHAMELYAVRVWLPALLMAVLVAGGASATDAAVKAATIGGVALAAGSVGPLIGGAISDRLGRARTAAGIFALSGTCSWAVGWLADVPWPLVVGVAVVYGWAISADSSIYSTAMIESAEPGDLGSTMAMHAFLGFMGGVVGPILVGGVLDIAPESIRWGVGFSVVGLLALIAIPVLLRVREPLGQPWASSRRARAIGRPDS